MRFTFKHTFLAVGAVTSFFLVAISGCSSDADPSSSTGGASTGGSVASTGGAPASGGSAGTASSSGGSAGMIGTTGGSAGAMGAMGGSAGAMGGGAGAQATAGASGSGTAGDPVQGQLAYSQSCSACHGTKGEGGLGPNVTGSAVAGIGSWTEAQFNAAVRQALGKDGQPLCPSMTAFPASTLSDAALKNIYAYLRSISNDTPNAGLCP